jgi:sterol 14alpha-demethylase
MFWLLASLVVAIVTALYFRVKPASIPSIPNATPALPFLGNAIHYGKDPVGYLCSQRARHGDMFLVDLVVLRMVFVLGSEGTNTIFKGTEKSGISMYAAAGEFFSETTKYCICSSSGRDD